MIEPTPDERAAAESGSAVDGLAPASSAVAEAASESLYLGFVGEPAQPGLDFEPTPAP